jgi:hypothetical protein
LYRQVTVSEFVDLRWQKQKELAPSLVVLTERFNRVCDNMYQSLRSLCAVSDAIVVATPTVTWIDHFMDNDVNIDVRHNH